MKYTTEELDQMLGALHEAIDELELNLNHQPESRQAYIEQLSQLSKIAELLNNLILK
jgi:hypothetical protein